MSYMWIKAGDYEAYPVELSRVKRWLEYVLEETTKKLLEKWGIYLYCGEFAK